MSNEDWKKDTELFDKETGREIAASGYPAPTMEEAIHELGIMGRLLSNHGCATTRDLINAASIVVDVSHKDAHSFTPPALQSEIVKFANGAFTPLQNAINEKLEAITKPEEKAKFLARMTSILLQIARITGAGALTVTKGNEIPDPIESEPKDSVPTPDQIAKIVSADSPEDAIKNLLDIPAKNGYKH